MAALYMAFYRGRELRTVGAFENRAELIAVTVACTQAMLEIRRDGVWLNGFLSYARYPWRQREIDALTWRDLAAIGVTIAPVMVLTHSAYLEIVNLVKERQALGMAEGFRNGAASNE